MVRFCPKCGNIFWEAYWMGDILHVWCKFCNYSGKWPLGKRPTKEEATKLKPKK